MKATNTKRETEIAEEKEQVKLDIVEKYSAVHSIVIRGGYYDNEGYHNTTSSRGTAQWSMGF